MSTKVAHARRAAKRMEVKTAPPVIRHYWGRRELWISALLAAATLAVYIRVAHYDYVFYDDDAYVYANPAIKARLTLASLKWAFGLHLGNWHPVTWLSYLIEITLFGMNAGHFHVVNVLLHVGSTILLFLALYRMTGKPWRCAMVAAIFALHPLHVESVAWVAERKDVLSTFFEMIALLLYALYVERRSVRRYVALCLAFTLGVLSKPMLVTFPVILLVLDFWPLRRIEWPVAWSKVRPVALEKAPLFVIALIASFLTVVAQKDFGTVATLGGMPVSTRIANAAIGYAMYLKMAFWPTGLGVLYPYVAPQEKLATIGLMVLVPISFLVLLSVRKQPYMLSGWLWYLLMLMPVIGIVQVGAQSRADRYMYVPLVGLALALVWFVGDLVEGRRNLRMAAAVASAVVLIALSIATWKQVGYWKDSRTLFEHTIAVTDRNSIMMNNLGVIVSNAGDHDRAIRLYANAIAIDPGYAVAYANFGYEMLHAGMLESARPLLQKAIKLKPDLPGALLDLGIVEENTRQYDQAISHFEAALKYAPDDAVIHSNDCYALEHAGRLDEAIAHCREALRLQPGYPDAVYNLKNSLAEKQQRQR